MRYHGGRQGQYGFQCRGHEQHRSYADDRCRQCGFYRLCFCRLSGRFRQGSGSRRRSTQRGHRGRRQLFHFPSVQHRHQGRRGTERCGTGFLQLHHEYRCRRCHQQRGLCGTGHRKLYLQRCKGQRGGCRFFFCHTGHD